MDDYKNILYIQDHINEEILFKGACSEFTNERILEREVKNVLTLYDDLDDYGENYIIINVK